MHVSSAQSEKRAVEMSNSDRLQTQLISALRRNLVGGKPVVPEAGVMIWNLFMEISRSRTYHAAGPHPISHGEIEAYGRLHRWPLRPHHVEMIRALDDAWLTHAYRKIDGKRSGVEHFAAPSQPVNPDAFDAVFG